MNFKEFKLYVLSRPNFEISALEDFLKDNGLSWKNDAAASSAERLVEAAGRICYMSFTDDISKIHYPNSAYISNLINQKHDSVLEHAVWSFIFDGVSRAFTHQLVRHRVGFSFSQLSQQYHNENDASFVVPYEIKSDKSAVKLWKEAIKTSLDTYKKIFSETKKNEPLYPKERKRSLHSVARSVMPNATASTIVVTANARAIRHFLDIRGTIEGDYEMRNVCVSLLKIVKQDAPSLFTDFEITNAADGMEIIKRVQT